MQAARRYHTMPMDARVYTSPATPMWHALRWPLLAAVVTRAVAAWVALSFHSRDDYFHVLAPALAWLQDPDFNWERSDLAGAGIRSHLLPRLVYWLLRGMVAMGVDSPDAQLRGLYLAMGLYSLTLVVAMYQAGLQFFGPVTARRAAFCAALFFPFPYAGTRLLIEALAMPPLLAGLTYLARARRRDALLGGACLGLAIVWRFQVAAVLPGLLGALWWARKPSHSSKAAAEWGTLAYAALGLVLVVGASGAYDWATQGEFLGPMWNNFVFNVNMPAHQSRSAPWGYAGFWLLLTLPPLVLWLTGPMLRAARAALFISLPWASFVLLHSAITHKEDRFMLPVVPLFALLLCHAWTLRDAGPLEASGWQRTWPTARAWGSAMLVGALAIGITGQSQANLRDAMLYLRQDRDVRGVVSLGPELQTYFLGRPDIPTRRSRMPSEEWLQQTLIEMHHEGVNPNRFVAYSADKNVVEVFLRLNGYACAPPVEIDGWWLDRLLAQLNPHRNQRRGPIMIHRCVTPDVAAG